MTATAPIHMVCAPDRARFFERKYGFEPLRVVIRLRRKVA